MDTPPNRLKRSSPAPAPWQQPNKDHRRSSIQTGPRTVRNGEDDLARRKEQESFTKKQTRLNQIQEAEQMREWVSKEDEFVLKQSKKKARIRVKDGRAKHIDWLAVTLSVLEPSSDELEDDGTESEIEVVDPTALIEGLSQPQLQTLLKDIDAYLILETAGRNRRYWTALQVLCQEQYRTSAHVVSHERSVNAVSTDVDKLLQPKNLSELKALESQINSKLQSNEPIDVEYWEQLLRSITVYKAKAELDNVYKSVVDGKLQHFKREQIADAELTKEKLGLLLADRGAFEALEHDLIGPRFQYSRFLDPEPHLKLHVEDKSLEITTEENFLDRIIFERRKVSKMGYVPRKRLQQDKQFLVPASISIQPSAKSHPGISATPSEDFSQATTALYEREVARGVQENEEIFAGEEEVSAFKPQWASKYRPRKPRYFNRVQMGYEWNKYNQTHYDHGNPPPKVVQGYKFNIFYPDLIDKTKAPTYRIERENGRKRGQSFAPAGEEDTCLIRFVSGPPYEDLAFRIVDKEWDYSAKRERGFRSSFDKGILQLHFQFKKVYYRK
ncbi:MAG: hypothetical protein Q9191_005219 [Dirinaria sp. TL-2023a]